MALTWLLYFLLDSIVFIATNKALIKSGGYQVLFASAIISLFMFIVLYRKQKIIWKWIEKTTIILIILCLGFWLFMGPSKAVLWGILSESFVGIYLLYKTIKDPVVKYNLLGYVLFLLACILAVYDAPNWSIYEIGYPTSEIMLTTLTIIPLLRKWYQKKKK